METPLTKVVVTLNKKNALEIINNINNNILSVHARKYFCYSHGCCAKISDDDAKDLLKIGYIGCSCNRTIYKIVIQILVNIPSEVPCEIPSRKSLLRFFSRNKSLSILTKEISNTNSEISLVKIDNDLFKHRKYALPS